MKLRTKRSVMMQLMMCFFLVNLLVMIPEKVMAGNTTVAALQSMYPDNSVWNGNNTYDNSSGCVAFAAKVFNLYYGTSFRNVSYHTNKSQIKPGDIIWYTATNVPTHNVWVIARNGDNVTVGEGNAYCIHSRNSGRVCWGRVLNLNNITVNKVYSAPYAINDSAQPSDDSYYYAKVEGTDGSLSINDRAASTSNGAQQLGAIPENGSCMVYNSGAVGNWKRVTFNGVTGYAYGTYLKSNLNPVGNMEKVTVENGMVRFIGWAFDYDRPFSTVTMRAYIGGPKGTGKEFGSCDTNMPGTDVSAAYPGIGDNHRFDLMWSTTEIGYQQVYMYAVNMGGGSDTVFGPYTVYIPCTHTWNSGSVISNATCTTTGSKKYTCTRCGDTKTETIPATGHQHVSAVNASAATCSQEGYTGDQYCSDCGTTLSRGSAIPKLDHSWDQGVITKQPTETAEGIKTYTCTGCGTTREENIPKLEVKETEKPQEPSKPQETEKPQEPSKPQETEKPQEPSKPQETEKPQEPSKPQETENSWQQPSGNTDNEPSDTQYGEVTLSAGSLPLQVKQSVVISRLIKFMTAGDRLVSCSSSNKKIATVTRSGKVTGKKAGTVKITMNFASGISKTVIVKVQKTKVTASKIANVPGSITLKVKKTYKLSPSVTPITTKDKAVYKTANKKIAAVSGSGKITAKKAGKTTITIKVGKKIKKVKVTVKK